jgi:zinc transport system substrate-binding protein
MYNTNRNYYDLKQKGVFFMKRLLVAGGGLLAAGLVLGACADSSESGSSEKREDKEAAEIHLSEKEHDHEHDGESHHDHDHADSEETKGIADGYFEDSQVKDRSLSDWEGDWQSVFPYLEDGTLDEVFQHKAEHEGDKTAEEYKEYYTKGCRTDVDRIVIKGDMVSFHENGKKASGTYRYDGYEILTYEAGNRGVRYIFKLEGNEGEGGLPRFIQFSDHIIEPTDAGHYHLYWGDDRNALLEEVINWPTYFPSEMAGDEIAHDMMEH